MEMRDFGSTISSSNKPEQRRASWESLYINILSNSIYVQFGKPKVAMDLLIEAHPCSSSQICSSCWSFFAHIYQRPWSNVTTSFLPHSHVRSFFPLERQNRTTQSLAENYIDTALAAAFVLN